MIIHSVIVILTIIMFLELVISNLPMIYLASRVAQLDLSSLDLLAGLSAWRDREAAALSQIVQHRLHTLQNPYDCKTAKKLICKADRVSGCVLVSGG